MPLDFLVSICHLFGLTVSWFTFLLVPYRLLLPVHAVAEAASATAESRKETFNTAGLGSAPQVHKWKQLHSRPLGCSDM